MQYSIVNILALTLKRGSDPFYYTRCIDVEVDALVVRNGPKSLLLGSVKKKVQQTHHDSEPDPFYIDKRSHISGR